jgi:DNA (cytosine-5)-methyltransferase 1
VDTTEITHLSLCSGYGGIDLGLRRCLPLRTVAYAEIEAFACEVLLARMEGGQLDPAPIWTDLRSFPWESFRDRVHLLSGGYPCQPFSSAGKRLGADDPRHLWPSIAAGIAILRPRVCFFENVEGHISLGLREVIADLERLGYESTWGIFSAAECGAPHQRKRVFILAYRKGEGLERYSRLLVGCDEPRWQSQESKGQADGCGNGGDLWPARPGQPQHAWEPPRVVGNAESRMSQQQSTWDWRKSAGGTSEETESMGNADTRRLAPSINAGNSTETDGRGKGDVEQAGCPPRRGETQPALGRDLDGSASRLDNAQLFTTCDNRTDELRLLGNGVVPATAAKAFRMLAEELGLFT